MAQYFPNASRPDGVTSGDTNPWNASEFVGNLIDRISAISTDEATSALLRFSADNRFSTYADKVKHAVANQRARRRESEFRQPNWRQVGLALSNDTPANAADLHALVTVTLKDVATRIAATNTDIYKRFWNEDGYGRILSPKPEESCRDVLIDLLRATLQPLGVIVEPEGHMAADKRADISVALPGQKIPIELKRDYHADVWRAVETQLDRFYTRDPEALGFGIYGVFWLGDRRGGPMPLPSAGQPRPRTAGEMEGVLTALIPIEKRPRISVVVIDTSGEVP